MKDLVNLTEKIKQLTRPFMEESGLVLIDLDLKFRRQDVMIQMIIDKPRGGITIGECSAINKKVRNKIDEEEILTGNYEIEVSSPGLDWPLKTKNDFLRVLDKEIHVELSGPIDDQKVFVGTIKEVQGEQIVVEYNNKNVHIPLAAIAKAVQLI